MIHEILQMMTEGPLATRGVIGDQSEERIDLLLHFENRILYILVGVILDVPKVFTEEFSTQPTLGGGTGVIPGKEELLGRSGAGWPQPAKDNSRCKRCRPRRLSRIEPGS